VRLALEELGVTYLKFGQYLATRFDILPEDLCRELNQLFENVTPLTFDEVTKVLEGELHRLVGHAFAVFDPQPIASASVAQVHEARSHSNERLAVKIQRPGIEKLFMADLRNLHRLAVVGDAFGLLGKISIQDMISEFGKWTLRELDFRLEGRTAEALRRNATRNEIVPRIHWELTTAKVLTMEFIEGLSLARIADLVEAGRMEVVRALLPHMNVAEVGRNLATAILHQFFVTGLFHGDPHPGNILIRDDNTVGFVDFGIFGELADYERQILAAHIENIALGNVDESFRYYAKLYFPSDETDPKNFELEGKSVLRRWYQASQNPGAPIRDVHLGKYSAQMFGVARRNRVRMRTDTLLFWRALNTLDSSALRLSAVFDLLAELRHFFEQLRPTVGERVMGLLTDQRLALNAHELAYSAPRYLSEFLDDVLRGQLEPPLGICESPRLVRRNDVITKVLAATISGISLTVLTIHSGGGLGVLSVGAALLVYSLVITELWMM
jgi:ubiquinone biosynthesis protein